VFDEQACVWCGEAGDVFLNGNWKSNNEQNSALFHLFNLCKIFTKAKSTPYVDATSVHPSAVCLSVCAISATIDLCIRLLQNSKQDLFKKI